jgi:hypothetical protein
MKDWEKQFKEEVFKPMFAVAFGTCLITVVLDYSFQLIEAIEVIAQ